MALRGGVEESNGEALTASVLAVRVGWAADLAAGMAARLLCEHWNAADVSVLAGGAGPDGRPLPSHAWMALRRLGWALPDDAVPGEVKVNDRIVRMAQEQAGRTLRGAEHRAGVIAGILAAWPANPGKRTPEEWDAVRDAVPDGRSLPSNLIKARTRQIDAFLAEHGRLPTGVFDLEKPPRAAKMLILAAVDRQQATIERHDADPARVVLRLQLPTRPDPRAYRDWSWVACPITLPPTVPTRAVLHLPTLRPQGARVRADLSFTHAVPAARRTGHTIALGVDWGLNTLLSAGACRLHDDGIITTSGAGAMFRATGILGKRDRLRRESEHIHAKLDQYQRLALRPGEVDRRDASDTGSRKEHGLGTACESGLLAARHARLSTEKQRISAKRSELNNALAKQAARWAVDQALAADATVIYLEDLRSMEATGQGRTHNTRMSQTVRGQVVAWMRHLAAGTGIAVVAVPAHNTSRLCPGCLVPLKHCAAPDRPNDRGWKWARCSNPRCGWQGDRDHGAWRRIAARGLTHQTTTSTDRTTGKMTIHRVIHKFETRAVIAPAPAADTAPVRSDRSKTGARARNELDKPSVTTRPVPRRRGVPSTNPHPARQAGQAGQRPEGHAPKAPTAAPGQLPRAAHRGYQGVTTISTPARPRHTPRGAALGAGFHLHAHATPPRWADPLSRHTQHDYGSSADQRR
ncbi:transposase [Actinomadura darangshiensis]|uniref:transposase n=1 Tax=Actinomadura darangshiensis TaxID=705336 RepID=UPI001FB68A49|nr:transposase [Actinomadura darangshiensis]